MAKSAAGVGAVLIYTNCGANPLTAVVLQAINARLGSEQANSSPPSPCRCAVTDAG